MGDSGRDWRERGLVGVRSGLLHLLLSRVVRWGVCSEVRENVVGGVSEAMCSIRDGCGGLSRVWDGVMAVETMSARGRMGDEIKVICGGGWGGTGV